MQDYGMFGNPGSQAGTMPSGNDRAAYEKAMSNRYANTLVSPGILGTPIGEQRGYTGQGVTARAGIDAQPTPGGGGSMSISLGGGNRGSSTPAGPNVSLTPQTFAPYKSTYTPPTPATPVPYDYATRSPYVYGDGLSNAGAAYDIWGSKPGTNPYLLSTPAGYTPGILGLDPVTLPGNMPNKGANINALSNVKQRQKFTGTPEQIIRDYGYTGRTVPMQNNVPPSMRDSAPNASVMLAAAAANVRNGRYNNMQEAMNAQQAFNKKYPTKTPAENKALIKASQDLQSQTYNPAAIKLAKDKATIKNTQGQTVNQQLAASRNAFKGASGPKPGQTTYSAKKTSAAKAVKKYTTKDVSKSFSARRDVRNLFA